MKTLFTSLDATNQIRLTALAVGVLAWTAAYFAGKNTGYAEGVKEQLRKDKSALDLHRTIFSWFKESDKVRSYHITDGDYHSLMTAMGKATNGDIVMIRPGYYEVTNGFALKEGLLLYSPGNTTLDFTKAATKMLETTLVITQETTGPWRFNWNVFESNYSTVTPE